MRRLLPVFALIIGLLITSVPTAVLAQVSDPPLVTLDIDDGLLIVGEGGKVDAVVRLAEPVDLRLRVVDYDGRTVRVLHDGPAASGEMGEGWFGRAVDREWVPRGPYRIVAAATAADGRVERDEAWVTVADRAVYPLAPHFITVLVDPGHGGEFSGAVAEDGTREADINLDIGLRLARMLEGAGVNVVITRSTDAEVNTPPEERTGDGVIDIDDDLAARPDLANEARADLFLSIHNNFAVNTSVGGPSTLYFDERPFGGRSARLARIIQEEMLAALDEAVGGDWEPHDHGTIIYPYYVLRGFDPPRLRRPTQMPGVLSEGLFLSNPFELRQLKRPAVRAAMADAYYDAIGKYLARRGDHVGYTLVEGPPGPVAPGSEVTYRIEVRNHGTDTIRGWRLKARAVDAPTRYVSRIRDAVEVGQSEIPRIEAGKSRVIELTGTAPGPGDWSLLVDARDRDGRWAAELGSPILQTRLSVSAPMVEPEPTLEPESTLEAGPDPAAAP
jgi:N-acetylmuramoyl-L-alanine amidase